MKPAILLNKIGQQENIVRNADNTTRIFKDYPEAYIWAKENLVGQFMVAEISDGWNN